MGRAARLGGSGRLVGRRASRCRAFSSSRLPAGTPLVAPRSEPFFCFHTINAWEDEAAGNWGVLELNRCEIKCETNTPLWSNGPAAASGLLPGSSHLRDTFFLCNCVSYLSPGALHIDLAGHDDGMGWFEQFSLPRLRSAATPPPRVDIRRWGCSELWVGTARLCRWCGAAEPALDASIQWLAWLTPFSLHSLC